VDEAEMTLVLAAAMLLLGASGDSGSDPAELTPVPIVEPHDWPLGGALGARLYCIEGHESDHGLHMLNRSSGAQGYLQWLPSTARQWSVSVGDRTSEWLAAARIAAQGERFFRSQWVPLQLGLC
jgi:hypothetical protein